MLEDWGACRGRRCAGPSAGPPPGAGVSVLYLEPVLEPVFPTESG